MAWGTVNKPANLLINSRVLAGASCVLIALIVITPLCGVMFDCGCTWPWEGLHRNCNYYDPQAMAKCPWCVSLTAGFTSVVLSISCGLWVSSVDLHTVLSATGMRNDAKRKLRTKRSWKSFDYILRVCSGLLVFLLIAVLSGWVTASWLGSHFFLH